MLKSKGWASMWLTMDTKFCKGNSAAVGIPTVPLILHSVLLPIHAISVYKERREMETSAVP